MQGALLGVALDVLDEDGQAVRDAVGELVVTRPMPAMPVGLWADPDGSRYRAAYFDRFPGVWTHGDWITVGADGTCEVRAAPTRPSTGPASGSARRRLFMDADARSVDRGALADPDALDWFAARAQEFLAHRHREVENGEPGPGRAVHG